MHLERNADAAAEILCDLILDRTVWNGDEDECWEYMGTISQNGYGYVTHKARTFRAHRVTYGFFIGPIPDGLVIDHLCRNRRCCNPWHLEAVTSRTNTLRGEGVAARHAKATHCPKGHPYAGDNLYLTPSGWRMCRTCMRQSEKEAYARKKAACDSRKVIR